MKIDKQEIDRERRKQRRLEQMGTNEPICLISGCTKWYNFEGHHIAGRHYDKEAVEYFSRDSHGDLTEEQLYHPEWPNAHPKPSAAICLLRYLCGLNDILRKINEFLEQNPSVFADRRTASIYLRALAGFIKRTSRRLRYHGIAVANETAKGRARNSSRRGKRR